MVHRLESRAGGHSVLPNHSFEVIKPMSANPAFQSSNNTTFSDRAFPGREHEWHTWFAAITGRRGLMPLAGKRIESVAPPMPREAISGVRRCMHSRVPLRQTPSVAPDAVEVVRPQDTVTASGRGPQTFNRRPHERNRRDFQGAAICSGPELLQTNTS